MSKIIRTPTKAHGGITPEEKTAMDAISQDWIAEAYRTDPADPAQVKDAIDALYSFSKLKPPRVVLVPSPLVMALAGGAASWIWHCRKKGHSATVAATRAATYAATEAATDAATNAATYAATHAATVAATYAATSAATYAATVAATHAAISAATDAATEAATDAAMYA